jgi:hypothetical protein
VLAEGILHKDEQESVSGKSLIGHAVPQQTTTLLTAVVQKQCKLLLPYFSPFVLRSLTHGWTHSLLQLH